MRSLGIVEMEGKQEAIGWWRWKQCEGSRGGGGEGYVKGNKGGKEMENKTKDGVEVVVIEAKQEAMWWWQWRHCEESKGGGGGGNLR